MPKPGSNTSRPLILRVKEWAKRYQGRKPIFYTSLSPDTANKVLRHLGVDDMFVPSRRVYSHTGVTIRQVCAASRGVVALFTANPLLAQLADPWGVSTIGIPGRYTRDWDQCTCTLDVGIKKGLFVGLSNLDLVFGIDALPPSDSKIATSDYRIAVGGPALSAAITCAKLGGNATLVTGLGNGVLSDVIRQECAQYGVRLVDIMPQKAMPNMSFVALHRNTSTREIVSGQTVESIQTLPDRFFDEFDYCLYDCNYPIYTEKLITALRKADVPLVLDCGAWKENLAPALQYAQYAIASAQFATPDGQDLISMQSKYRLHYAAITHGGDPITYCDRGHTGTIQVDTKTNVLTLGAGDVLHGAFCYYCLNQGLPFVEALRLASQHATHFVAQN